MWITFKNKTCKTKNTLYICPMKNNNIINKHLFYNCIDVCCFIESLPNWVTPLQRERLIKLFACYRPTTQTK